MLFLHSIILKVWIVIYLFFTNHKFLLYFSKRFCNNFSDLEFRLGRNYTPSFSKPQLFSEFFSTHYYQLRPVFLFFVVVHKMVGAKQDNLNLKCIDQHQKFGSPRRRVVEFEETLTSGGGGVDILFHPFVSEGMNIRAY